MCLAVPARLVEVTGDRGVIEIGGLRRPIRIPFIEDPKPGDYVLVHAGFAIRKWSEEDVQEYREILKEMGMDLDAPAPAPAAREAEAPPVREPPR